MAEWAVAVAAAILVLVHVAFPVVVLTLGRLRPRPFRDDGPPCPVTVVLAAHDEADVIGDRIRNLLAQDYPPELLQVVVACDGSPETHARAQAVASSRVEVLNLPRVGKAEAMNAALAHVRHDIVAFTDANTEWEPTTLRALVAPFVDPQVGGTAGDQRYVGRDRTDGVASSEDTYWSLDRALKSAQSRIGSVTSATGAVHALRRELVDDVPGDVTDDFFLSTGAVMAGRRLVFVPRARAIEPLAPDRQAEFARKVRIITRGLRAVRLRAPLLDPRRHGFYALQLLVHKVLRRLLFIPLVVLFVGSLVGAGTSPPLRLLAVAQVAFYGLAVIGLAIPSRGMGRASRLVRLPAYFCLVYAAAAVATWRVLRGRGVDRWGHRRLTADASVTREARTDDEARPDTATAPDRAPPRAWAVLLTALALACLGALIVVQAPVVAITAIAALAVLTVTGLPSMPTAAAVALVLLYSNAPVLVSQRLGLPATMTALAVPGLLALAAWHQLVVERRPIVVPDALPWLLLYLGAVVASAVLSPASGASVEGLIIFLTEGLLLYVLIVAAVRDTRTLRACVGALVATASVLGLLSVLQTVTGSYHTDYFGFAQHAIEDVQAFLTESDRAPARVAGQIGEKNRYAQVLLMLVPIPLVMAIQHPRLRMRLVGAAAATACVSGVALTASRGAAVAAALLLMTMLVLRVIGVGFMVVAAVGVLIVGVTLPNYMSRLVSATAVLEGPGAAQAADGAVQGRLASNLGSLEVFLDHSITGVGPGNYPRYHKAAVEDLGLRVVPHREPHNLYLGLAAETGIVGLTAFLAVVVVTLRGLWLVHTKHPPGSLHGMLATGFLLGLLAYLYAGVFLHLSYARYFWMLLALGGAIPLVDQEATQDRLAS